MFQANDAVTVDTSTASAWQYANRHDLPTDQPVPAVITRDNGAFSYVEVRYPDGTNGEPVRTAVALVTVPPEFQNGDLVTVAPTASARYGHAAAGLPEAGRVIGTAYTWEGTEYAYRVAMASDGCEVPATADELAPITPEVPTSTPETPAEAPEPSDPLAVWEAGLADADALLDAVWQAADAAADAEHACSEYEATAARPHGHIGRERMAYDEDSEARGAGEVTFTRTITRRTTVTQSITIDVEAGDDPYDTLSNTYADWDDDSEDDYEEEDDYGPSIDSDDREPVSADPEDYPREDRTRPAALVRAAIDGRTPYAAIRDAILTTLQEHGAPITRTHSVSMTAVVSRPDATGHWQAGTSERVDAHRISATEADALRTSGPYAYEAYVTARRVFETNNTAARIAFPTLALTVATEWEVNA